MRKLYTFLVIVLMMFTSQAQIVNIPDANFKAKLIALGVDTNADGNIQTSEALAVTTLNVMYSNISDLTGLTAFTNLLSFNCQTNSVSTLDLTGLNALTELKCVQNQISTLDVSGLPNLTTLWCYNNQMQSLSLGGNIHLNVLYCNDNSFTALDVSGLTNLTELQCQNNQLTAINLLGLTHLNKLDCSYNQLSALDLTGLTLLQRLNCSANLLTTLNASGLIHLTFLGCQINYLTELNYSGDQNLAVLGCNWNQLTSLNLTGFTQLTDLSCRNNNLTSLNLNGLVNLHGLDCRNNQITYLNGAGLLYLSSLRIGDNPITNFSFPNLANVQILDCGNTLISTMDLSTTTYHLGTLWVDNNPQLTSLFIKTGSGNFNFYSSSQTFKINGDPNLQYICVDESNINATQNQINSFGYTNCHVNSYCSFSPGGTFYTLQGNNRYDSNNNGCDSADIPIPSLKLMISNGTNTATVIPDTTGSYHYDVQAGTHTITPVFENSTYFTTSPSTATVTFPTATSPITQNFCLTANGIHNDLEVIIIPIKNARPGFDANYKIIFKNKGNTTQSGTVSLDFSDSILDYVSATPSVTTQTTNSLVWAFSNLAPFETRQILVIMNVNSPTETPAVNEGDILHYTATVNVESIDETPLDNTINLIQNVVNALDPNEKTCVEGTTITSEMVGEYVHYVIGFENDGSADAENIVVMDRIDTSKFDISTLVPLSGSASYTTRITNSNKVEFIFENINLPFTAGNNTGYVAFKIKTKPNLVVGDTFSNSASIYFDYNYPVLTNTATTTIAVLANQDFDFSTYFSVYPVPAKQVLNIQTKEGIGVKSMEVYNVMGQLVIAIPNAQGVSTIDVSNLKAGTYFIKLNTDKGTTSTKFAKE